MSDVKDVAVIENDQPIIRLSATEAAIAALEQQYSGRAFDLTNEAGMAEAKGARRQLVALRTSLEERRKQLKQPAIEFGRKLDAEAKRLTTQLLAIENPLDLAIQREEQRRQAEKDAKAKAEGDRVRAHQTALQSIERSVLVSARKPVEELQAEIERIEKLRERDWEEMQGAAMQAIDTTIETLRSLMETRRAADTALLRTKIARYSSTVGSMAGASAASLRTFISGLCATPPTKVEFGDLVNEATEAWDAARLQAETLLQDAEEHERLLAEHEARQQTEFARVEAENKLKLARAQKQLTTFPALLALAKRLLEVASPHMGDAARSEAHQFINSAEAL